MTGQVAKPADESEAEQEVVTPLELLIPLAQRWKQLLIVPILAAFAAWGASFLVEPTFTSRATFLPPQQPQSAAAAALGQLSSLAGFAGGGNSLKNPADQYVSLMESVSITDRILDQFELMKVYDLKLRVDARKRLAKNVRIWVGLRDGLITVEVDDGDAQRSADMANAYLEELKRMTSALALTEAQQRRAFFQSQLALTSEALTKAQLALQASGFNPGALKAEPKAAADSYARMRAELTSAEVRLQTLRRGLADTAPEVQQQVTLLAALRNQVSRVEASTREEDNAPGYITRYREFKYQETLFDMFARQYEMARVDESREGLLIQPVDVALKPERKSRPRRLLVALGGYAAALFVLTVVVLVRASIQRSSSDPRTASRLQRLRSAWRGS
jgi:capsule polysaccharide export protein KpsE/RkpR